MTFWQVMGILLALPTGLAAGAALWKVVVGFSGSIWWVHKHGKTIVSIAEQFQPNHGTSLRDSIDRIEKRLEAGDARMQGIEGKLTQIATHCKRCKEIMGDQ